jgi:heat shock protein HslJ
MVDVLPERVAAGVAAAAAVGAFGLVIAVSGTRADAPVATSTSSASASTTLPLAAALIGTWRPVEMVGYNGPLSRSGSDNADVRFAADGRWRGSDGCNGLGGPYKATDAGAITAEPGGGGTTAMWCNNVPNDAVLDNATRFTIVGRSLVFYTANGQMLGTYQHV